MNAKGIPSNKMMKIPDGNTDLRKEVKNGGKGTTQMFGQTRMVLCVLLDETEI